MRNKISYLLVLLLTFLCLGSCTKDISIIEEQVTDDAVNFRAVLDANDVKTYLFNNQIRWQKTDSVSLWYGTLNSEMAQSDYFVESIDASDTRIASLKGLATSSPDYLAVYPLSASRDCSANGELTVELPTTQSAIIGTFAPKANVSVAYSNDSNLAFKNIGGLLALRLNSDGGHEIVSIRLTGTSAMSGEVSLQQASIASGSPSVDTFGDAVNYLTLNLSNEIWQPTKSFSATKASDIDGEGEAFNEEDGDWGKEPVYLVSLPGSHTGFVLTLVDSEGKTAVAKSTHAFTVTRNSNTVIASISAPSDPAKWRAAPKVYINEVDCKGKRIELFNPNAEDVDLSGWLLVKDEHSWAFPVGSTVPSGGYLVVNCKQTDCSTGPTFGVSGDKGFVLSLVNGTVVDCIDNSGDDRKVIGETETYGRRTDGSGEWVIFSKGTIYEEGVCDGDNSKGVIKGDEPETVTVVLNEINGNDKYVELRNVTDQPVDITGWKLEKDGDVVWTASDASQCTIAAGAYLAIDFVKKSKDPKEAASGLSAGKTLKLALQDASGTDVDVFKRGEKGEGWGETSLPEHEEWSFSRVPDGSGAWKYALPTKGSANGEKTGTIEQYPAADGSVVLNELNGNDKFIELYNTSTDYSISLEDMTLYKDDGASPVWTGAAGLSIAPGGYLLLYSEDKKTPETYDGRLIFSSGLSEKKSLKIELRAADGTSTMDCFTRGNAPWGTKISGCTDSYGRTPDGTGSWQLIDKTPGSANGDSKGDIPQS